MTEKTPFDKQARDYDAWFEKHRDLYLAELEAVRNLVPASGAGVEIGVGTGRFAVPLGIPIGVEPAPRMAELARQRGIEVLENFAEALPFAYGSFDFAVMVTVVCFLNDAGQAFRESYRASSGLMALWSSDSSTVRAHWDGTAAERKTGVGSTVTPHFIR